MLGARIALLRRQAGLSQRELARELEISASAVGMYEQQRRSPSMELLVRMAQRFGVSTDFLLTGSGEPADNVLRCALADKTLRELTGNAPNEDSVLLFAGIWQAEELTRGQKSAMMVKIGGMAMTDEAYMLEALKLAREAAAEGEVPVGCVIVDGERIVGRGRNRRETQKNALCHAELEAIDEACRTLGGWRLWRCTMYVTLEPCPMCAGAVINARIPRLVYGAHDEKAGSCGTLTNLFALPYNHRPEVTGGVLEADCGAALRDFFRSLRENPTVKTWRKL